MSLVPAFELGLWNAWMFIVLHQGLTSVLLQLYAIGRYGNRDVWKDVWTVWKQASTEPRNKRLEYMVYIVYFAVFGYSIFLPLKFNTIRFFFGLFIYILGVIVDFMAGVSWATNPLDKPITTGIYSISRHPMDFGNVVVIIGTGIACASWILPLLGIVIITLNNMSAVN